MLSQNNNSPVISSRGDLVLLKKLIIAAKNGDKTAFEELYKQTYTPLYRYTISKCHNVELTEDICQQTFLKFYQALATYEPETSPLAYLFTIAKHLLINHGEKKTFVPFDDTLLETYDDTSVNILDDTHVKLLAEKINEYLPSLTENEQDVIHLYFYGEFTYKEIGEILYKEEAYIRKIKERALKKLCILTSHLYAGN
jgi:RNA polymerase sigma-70 factor (ECF subfamily)